MPPTDPPEDVTFSDEFGRAMHALNERGELPTPPADGPTAPGPEQIDHWLRLAEAYTSALAESESFKTVHPNGYSYPGPWHPRYDAMRAADLKFERAYEDLAEAAKTAIPALAFTLAASREEAAAAHEALRSLACWLGVGGYNAETVDAGVFERKIRDGVDALVRVETVRARGPQISDSEEKALLRRTNAEFESSLALSREEAARLAAERDRLRESLRNVLKAWSTEANWGDGIAEEHGPIYLKAAALLPAP